MSEPKATATKIEEVVPRIWYWHLHDERTDFLGAAHAVGTDDGTILVDPLPLAADPFEKLGRARAICLTTSGHQRSAWRLRRELGVPVWAPALTRELEEEPDRRYEEGDDLPGGLRPIFTPGAGTRQFSLLLDGERAVLFTPDLFVRRPGEPLMFTPAEYMHDAAEARRSAERLLELDFSVLCTGHGVPVADDPHAAIRAALAA